MKKIGVFTSGGDSPGMNAAIRSVVRTCIYLGITPYGIYRGYEGMMEGEIQEMSSSSVGNILQRGGTILKSARSEKFRAPEGRMLAAKQLEKNGIEGLVAIGGDGTFTGAKIFYEEFGIPTIGIPGTIDCDLFGTDFTLGFDTAINTAMQAIDKIRDTADSHHRLFIVEVMGRDAGFIALWTGLATGAESILVPETSTNMDSVIQTLESGYKRNKASSIIVVAEGDDAGGAFEVANQIKARFSHFDIRVSILGHMQRGGSPTCYDRVLGARLGEAAVNALLEGRKNEMAGLINNQVSFTAFGKAIKHNLDINLNLVKLNEILSS
jgi:6-phosphofructokinase 1